MKKLWKWEVLAFIWSGILGVLLHFAYDWLGRGRLVALFSAVNESTWEHLKLLFVPELIFSIISYWYLKEDYPGLLWVRTKGILVGMFTIVVVFYTYTGILGKSISWINILIFFLGVAMTSRYVLKNKEQTKKDNYFVLAVLVLAILSLCFMVFTFYPPNIGLFQNPIVGE